MVRPCFARWGWRATAPRRWASDLCHARSTLSEQLSQIPCETGPAASLRTTPHQAHTTRIPTNLPSSISRRKPIVIRPGIEANKGNP